MIVLGVMAFLSFVGTVLAYSKKWGPFAMYSESPPVPQNTPQKQPLPSHPPIMTNADKLYETAKNALGTRQTLNNNVPSELGCAEAWSSIAKSAGVSGIPTAGFAGTIAVFDFIKNNPDFQEITFAEPGATIISVTSGNKHGHVGYLAKFNLQYVDDFGIISNDSNTGTVREQWSLSEWQKYYTQTLGLVTHIYKAIG